MNKITKFAKEYSDVITRLLNIAFWCLVCYNSYDAGNSKGYIKATNELKPIIKALNHQLDECKEHNQCQLR